MKDELFGGITPEAAFPKRPESDLLDEKLSGCLKRVMQHNRDFTSLETYFLECDACNTMNLQALLRATLSIQPGGKTILSVMAFVANGEQLVSHPGTIRPCLTHLDWALAKDLAYYRSNDRSAAEWWATRKQVAQLVLPLDSTEKAMADGAKAIVLISDIDLIANSSQSGKELVRRTQRDAHQEKYATLVAEAIGLLLAVDLTLAVLATNRLAFQVSLRAVGTSASETHRPAGRVVKYLGVPLELPVTSLLDYCNLAIEALVRLKAVESHSLEPLFSELDLADPSRQVPAGKVDPDLCKATASARAASRDFMAGMEPTSRNIERLFTKRGAFLTNADFHTEMTYFACPGGDLGMIRVHHMIWRALPTERSPITPAESLGKIQMLGGCALLEFAGFGSRSVFSFVKALARSVAEKAMRALQGVTGADFFKQVKISLALFASIARDGAPVEAAPLRGEVAAKYQFPKVKASVDSGGNLELRSLSLLVMSGWLLDENEQGVVKTWRATAAASGVAVISGGKTSSSSTNPNGAQGKRGAKSKVGIRAKEIDALTRSLSLALVCMAGSAPLTLVLSSFRSLVLELGCSIPNTG